MIYIPVSNAELVDKLTILKIKKEKVKCDLKLKNINKEYNLLKPYLNKIKLTEDHELFKKLYSINLSFWEYHDWQREKWNNLKDFNTIDKELYIRSKDEHILNDQRARVKKEINKYTESGIVEEKQFLGYNI